MRDTSRESDNDWIRVSIRSGLNAAAEARHALPELVAGIDFSPERFADLELLVSELVTNAVTHTDSETVDLRVRLGDPLRVCVVDDGEGEPAVAVADTEIGGWGLRLVDALADTWGVLPFDAGKGVWFDLATNHSEPPTT